MTTPAEQQRVDAASPEGGAAIRPRCRGSVVDVFCGIGGLSHGFVLEGFDVRAGLDVDTSCRHAYEANNGARFLDWDVADAKGDAVQELFAEGEPRILVGCAPCQPFSTYSRNRSDTKWRLLKEFGRIVREVEPDIVSMENVARLTTFHKGTVLADFLSVLGKLDYTVWHDIVDCSLYGVPQTRKRLVVLASKVGPIKLVPPTHEAPDVPTVHEAISELPPIAAGSQHPDDVLHRASRLSKTNLDRIQASTPGGTWEDWDREMRAKCHQRHSGRWYGSVYGRMSWDAPAPTITTQCTGFGNGRFGHPNQDRAISLREAALLQTFPSDYEFFAPSDRRCPITATARWIGNAVPVELARAIARSVRHTISEPHDA